MSRVLTRTLPLAVVPSHSLVDLNESEKLVKRNKWSYSLLQRNTLASKGNVIQCDHFPHHSADIEWRWGVRRLHTGSADDHDDQVENWFFHLACSLNAMKPGSMI